MDYNRPQDSVPLPESMSGLPRDKRGYPIPWIVQRDSKGKPHFTINDHRKVKECGKFGLCGICGKALGRNVRNHPEKGGWFVGGPASFYSPRGAFLDPPMHKACATYALKVCPYIANPSYGKRIDGLTMRPEDMPAGLVLMETNPHALASKPPLFILGLARNWDTFEPAPGNLMFRPRNFKRDWAYLEAWRDGEQLDIESREVRDEIFRRLMAVANGSE